MEILFPLNESARRIYSISGVLNHWAMAGYTPATEPAKFYKGTRLYRRAHLLPCFALGISCTETEGKKNLHTRACTLEKGLWVPPQTPCKVMEEERFGATAVYF